MKSTRQFAFVVRRCSLPAAALAFTLTAVAPAPAADDEQGPLVLKAQGSFFIGGETEHTATTGTAGGVLFPNDDDIKVNQMYVQFQIPAGAGHHVPVVMLHGCCLSGKTWETTPDGRMGWGEYFVRQHYPVYIPDQSSRARSGFDATSINEVRLGNQPPSTLPNIFTFGRNGAWQLFRFGPAYPAAFSDEQFPVDAIDEFGKQVIPDLNATLPTPNPTYANLAALAAQLKGAVLMGHSESGFFPEEAALTSAVGVVGLISIEGFCTTNLTTQQIATLAKIPTLVIYGDHLGDVPSVSALWLGAFQGCQQFVGQLNAAGGDATMLHLPDAGLLGNSHMLMQDKNNLRIADLILRWIDEHVEGR
jgi:pimeloyl-ACP methyl ester carboxylesterase